MDSPQVDNETDFVVHPQMLVDRDGEKLVAMVKATWELPRGSQELELAPEERQRFLRPTAFPWGLPGESCDQLPADYCLRKPGTDIVLAARAYAPNDEPAPQWDVSARVGSLTKLLRIFGLRVWEGPGTGISAPRPIRSLDIRYEYAWGGLSMNEETGDIAEEARNPMGRGISLDDSVLADRPAPQIEDPFDLISSVLTKPKPAGFGPVMRHWEPRRRHSGTYDEKWLDERAPLTPADEDDRINIFATPDLHSDAPLVGGEAIAIAGTVPGGGQVSFTLPKIAVEIEFRVGDRDPEKFRPHLDTVIVDQINVPEAGWPVVEMVWRATVRAPRKMGNAKVIVREVKP